MLLLDSATTADPETPAATSPPAGLDRVFPDSDVNPLLPLPVPDLLKSSDVSNPEFIFGRDVSNELALFGIPAIFSPVVVEGLLDPPREGLGP